MKCLVYRINGEIKKTSCAGKTTRLLAALKEKAEGTAQKEGAELVTPPLEGAFPTDLSQISTEVLHLHCFKRAAQRQKSLDKRKASMLSRCEGSPSPEKHRGHLSHAHPAPSNDFKSRREWEGGIMTINVCNIYGDGCRGKQKKPGNFTFMPYQTPGAKPLLLEGF